ncbi:hypothetical protein Aperf_G00000115750 [Anoplocephala perfoliata]
MLTGLQPAQFLRMILTLATILPCVLLPPALNDPNNVNPNNQSEFHSSSYHLIQFATTTTTTLPSTSTDRMPNSNTHQKDEDVRRDEDGAELLDAVVEQARPAWNSDPNASQPERVFGAGYHTLALSQSIRQPDNSIERAVAFRTTVGSTPTPTCSSPRT